MKKIIIIGGGASGMMAAYHAAEAGKAANSPIQVIVLEKNMEAGKKLLCTGNGRCNLTNEFFPENYQELVYRSNDPGTVQRVINKFPEEDVLSFFQDRGMFLKNKKGYLYPRSGQARAVRDFLFELCKASGVRFEFGRNVIRAEHTGGRFLLYDQDQNVESCDCLIFACGGKAAPGTGSNGALYPAAERLGHHIVPLLPALVGLHTDKSSGTFFQKAAGVRFDGSVTLYVNEKREGMDMGEVQLVSSGVSGIPVFQVSSIASRALYEKKSVEVSLDFCPEFSLDTLSQLLLSQAEGEQCRTAEQFLNGFVPSKLGAAILLRVDIPGCLHLKKMKPEERDRLLCAMKDSRFSILSTEGFDKAQVTSGGVDLREVMPETLMSKLQPGLFFCGEFLNVDGICGGYNLQWAWSSGKTAGKGAADFLKQPEKTSSYRWNQCRLCIGHQESELRTAIQHAFGFSEKEGFSYEILRRSLDARKKDCLQYSYVVDVTPDQPLTRGKIRSLARAGIQRADTVEYSYAVSASGKRRIEHPPVIVGMGPAGLFCAYMLAKEGLCPVILERGDPVKERQKKVASFWETGVLDPESNIQFGEGGAGTFSDGKLNTLVKDRFSRNRLVLKTFVQFGAPADILYEQKPHIGTDLLTEVVKNMREEILRLGGDIRFRTKFVDFKTKDGSVCSITTEKDGTSQEIACETLVLATGHSARDTFEMLCSRGLPMEAKAFAVGVRILHPQKMISESQYGREGSRLLPPASYKVAGRARDGRGVYSFCMCPGGYVINASSEPEQLTVNGMSYHSRASASANSALIVTVSPEDFQRTGEKEKGSGSLDISPLSGISYQRKLESLMYRGGNGAIPVQLYDDFKHRRLSSCFYDVEPCFCGKTSFARLDNLLPDYIYSGLLEGISAFGTSIRGFDRPDAILAGIESRTSSPVRILRDETFQTAIKGIYPCGEGAGYAGGITSAAMDGIRVFEKIIG